LLLVRGFLCILCLWLLVLFRSSFFFLFDGYFSFFVGDGYFVVGFYSCHF
jgi:hypothetical protein